MAGESARLNRGFALYVGAVLAFVGGLAQAERAGLARVWIAAIFLLAPVVLYASIGLACRTTDSAEYFVAGRRVPAFYNGMAIAADWMSVASFMGLAGLLFVNGHAGLAYVLGWTGGFCLVGLLIAPYLRRFGRYTIPDFLAERYGGTLPRLIGALVSAACSFLYVVAQIYGVGLVTSRLTGFSFEIGIFVGLGGVLVCSFLGGMRAVTWTQVAQYVILLLAFLVPVVWLAVKQTGNPWPQAAAAQQLPRLAELERALTVDPREREVIESLRAEAGRHELRLANVEAALAEERLKAQRRVEEAAGHPDAPRELRSAERALLALPKDAELARDAWTRARDDALARARPLAGMPPQAQVYAGDPAGSPAERAAFADSRLNFLALVFCLMAGTAGLPHVLTRFYTTPDVPSARRSVTWALLFIVLLYISAPVLAVLLKVEVLSHVVGLRLDALPRWVVEWSKVDPGLISVADINGDGILQLAELRIGGDILVLAAPEIGGMPFVVSCLVAAGALAAALSTADGLLLTCANALSHDLYFKLLDRDAPTIRRVAVSKVVLLVIALLAAYIATQKPAEILLLVTPVFSLAAATLFPALVLGVFWRRTSAAGASAGMLAGAAVTLYYLITRHPALQGSPAAAANLWLGIQPGSAGVFGLPAALLTSVTVSLVTPRRVGVDAFLEALRRPARP